MNRLLSPIPPLPQNKSLETTEKKKEGCSLSFALQKYAFILFKRRKHSFLVKHSFLKSNINQTHLYKKNTNLSD